MKHAMEGRDADSPIKPFGIEFLEELVISPEVLGAQGCSTTWSTLKSDSDDIDGTSDGDPCI